jgi:hypothetical protein
VSGVDSAIVPPMTSAQDPPVRRKQKARRSKQLAAWRVKKASAAESPASPGPAALTKKA